MKNILILSCTLVSTFLLSSCTKVLDVTLDQGDTRLVVDGLVSNELVPFRVKLSTTVALDDTNGYPAVNNAFVTISDNVGNLDTLVLEGNGVYKTIGPRQGVVGRTYILNISVNGKTYIAKDFLTSITPIDSMYVTYQEKGSALGISEDGYYAYFFSTDPQNEKNYYFFEVDKNGTSVIRSNQVYVFDDKFNGAIIFSRLPGRYDSGDKIHFRFNSVSEQGYNYLNGVALQLQNDGGFFSTPPANAPTNLSGGALGFFRASSVSVDSLTVP